jgi:hypothetical protein
MNKMNNLFILPPFCNQIYRVQALNQQHALFEKVIEFQTGAANNIIDILSLIDTKKYRINYIVCNRERSFIAFRDGIDAIEAINVLRSRDIYASFATCYAHIDDEGNNQTHPLVARNPARSVILNRNRGFRARGIHHANVSRTFRPTVAVNDARHNIRPVYNDARGRGRGFNRGRIARRRNYPQQMIRNNAPRAVRVPLPDEANAGQYEWILVRK